MTPPSVYPWLPNFMLSLSLLELEYANRELMTNIESSGTEVIMFRKYYMPEQYIQDSIGSPDFIKVDCYASFPLFTYFYAYVNMGRW